MAIIPADEKVFMVDKRTNTVYGGSQALQDMQQWYTMQDVSDSVGGSILPYKVFTALLTQSGGDDQQLGSDFPLVIGVTYLIDDNAGDADFTNVGAPSNENGTYFIATGTIPANWGDGTLIYNTGAPVVTVLENTIGNITFAFSGNGQYDINSINLFIDKKTFILVGSTGDDIYAQSNIGACARLSSDQLRLTSSLLDGNLSNDQFLDTPIEIRVYN